VELISWEGFWFFLIAPILAWSTQDRWRNFIIGFLNLIFAAFWIQKAFLLMLAAVCISYVCAKKIVNEDSKIWLIAGVAVTLCPVLIFLWPAHFVEFNKWRGIWLHASVAFFSLQASGALLDIRWGRANPPNSIWHWLSFCLFFPSLFAGPICKWSDLGKCISSPHSFTLEDGFAALRLFGQGLFKKMVFSAPLFFILDRYFLDPKQFGWITAVGMALILRYAIWAEIGSHADWARGAARLLGYQIPRNFHYPFQTLRLAEFWRSWHMSLSGWLQDYVFTPLALGQLRRIFSPNWALIVALLAAFAVLGVWHGLTLSFLIMGLINGLGVILSEGSWRRCEMGNHSLFRLYKWTVAPMLILGFMILPTLLLRIEYTTLTQIFSMPDYNYETSWNRLTEITDGAAVINRSLIPVIAAGFIYEGLLYISRKGINSANPTSNDWDFAQLAPWVQALILLVGFILFMFFADFGASRGFIYVRQ
jgi:D-alanyl-lipoteichoic acid acyltransferase DltB (MBOAT superfamily)